MVLSYWFHNKLLSNDRVDRHYAYLVTLIAATTLLFAAIKPIGMFGTWGAPLCTLWALMIVICTFAQLHCERTDRYGWSEGIKLAQFLLLILVVPVFYDGVNVVNRYRYSQVGDALLYDEQLVKMDNALLGWAFPKGQLALFLDTNEQFGVTTAIGRVGAEILQVMYVSYYAWGNVLAAYLAYLYWYLAVYKQNKSAKKRLQWRRLQMFTCGWVGSFVFNFLLNLVFPAVSPRIYLADYYTNEVEGLWVTGWLRGALTSAASGTFSAFPSGHCGQSWLAALLAYRIGYKAYTYANIVAATLISLATLVLRYHYFVDFLFCFTTLTFGAWLGAFHDASLYASLLSRSSPVLDEEMGLVSSTGKQTEATPRSAAVQPLMEIVSQGETTSRATSRDTRGESIGDTSKQQQD